MKTSIIIGRFQIAHLGHQEMIKKALSVSDRLIIIIGSWEPFVRTKKNPFLYHERERMIDIITQRMPILTLQHISDRPDDNDGWVKEIKECVAEFAPEDEIILCGHERDESSFYLKLFPDWKFFEVGKLANDISASMIRDLYFSDQKIESIKDYVDPLMFKFLLNFKKTREYKKIVDEVINNKEERNENE